MKLQFIVNENKLICMKSIQIIIVIAAKDGMWHKLQQTMENVASEISCFHDILRCCTCFMLYATAAGSGASSKESRSG